MERRHELPGLITGGRVEPLLLPSSTSLISPCWCCVVMAVFNFSDRWDRAPIDDVLGSVDRGGAIGDQKGDQLGDFLGPIGTADRNPAQRIHQPLARGALVNSSLPSEAEDETVRRHRFGKPRRDSRHTNAF